MRDLFVSMEQNVFAALAHGCSASFLSRSLCCYVSQREHLDEKGGKNGSFIYSSLFFSRFACRLTTHFFSRKKIVLFFKPVLSRFVVFRFVLFRGCWFPIVVFRVLFFFVWFSVVLVAVLICLWFCFVFLLSVLVFIVVFHCCLLFIVVFHCCFSCVFCLKCVVFSRLCL